MKIKAFLLMLLTALFYTTMIHAADRPAMDFYGFSAKGDYCAFELYGVQDGSGFPYSKIYIIDVDNDKYATKPIITVIEEDPDDLLEARRRNMAKAIPALRRFGIDTAVKGTHLFSYPDFDQYRPNRNQVDYNAKTVFIEDKQYTIQLTEKDTGKVDPFGFEGTIKMMKLALVEVGSDRELLLQNDTELPKSREMTKKYRLSSAYYYNGRIAVFVEYERPGFEGNDQIKMVVTGRIIEKPYDPFAINP